MSTKFKVINDCLEEYYKSMGSNHYIQDDGRGKFLAFCEDDGHDEDDMDEELKEDPADCIYCDFDVNFPLCNGTDPDDRRIEVLKVLTFIHKNGKPPKPLSDNDDNKHDNDNDPLIIEPSNEQKELSSQHIGKHASVESNKKTVSNYFTIDIDTHSMVITEIKQICKNQAEPIFDAAALGDKDLMYLLAVGHVSNDYTFLVNLHDAFVRDRLTRPNIDLSIDWINSLPISKKLSNNHNYRKNKNKFITALSSYTKRICPKSQKLPVSLIRDSLRDIALYVALASKFVNSIITEPDFSNDALVPFQMDLMIAVKGCKHILQKSNTTDDDDDDDGGDDGDDGDGDGDDDNHSGEEDNDQNDDKKEEVQRAIIGDVMKKLDDNDCELYKQDINVDYFEFLREEFKDDSDEEKQKEIVELDAKRAGFGRAYTDYRAQKMKNMKLNKSFEYPRKRKFAGFLDRRESKDSVIIFEPPEHTNMPEGAHIPEWYFASLSQCSIPGTEKEKPITARSACNGELITFSFHVDAMDEIRCYWVWNGQSFRFLPNDIIDIMPKYFDMDCGDNEKFKKSEEAKRICKVIKIPNKAFNAFYDTLHRE